MQQPILPIHADHTLCYTRRGMAAHTCMGSICIWARQRYPAIPVWVKKLLPIRVCDGTYRSSVSYVVICMSLVRQILHGPMLYWIIVTLPHPS